MDDARIGLFTDTLDEINGVARFIADLSGHCQHTGRQLNIYTSVPNPRVCLPNRINFPPAAARPLPYYPDMWLSWPPLSRIAERVRQDHIDTIHISTPGPMGLCGRIIAHRLGRPMLATFHTDLPAYLRELSRLPGTAHLAETYLRWFYKPAIRILLRSGAYRQTVSRICGESRLLLLPPAIDASRFNRIPVGDGFWQGLGIARPHRLLYVGRISREKNLAMLVDIFRRVCQSRNDVALVLAGDGPHRLTMQSRLRDLPAHFLGWQDDQRLAQLYSAADLLLFPSTCDTLGQVVLEAQSCGLPAIVSDKGGPAEIVADRVTGRVLAPNAVDHWCSAVISLLDDSPARSAMSAAAPARASRHRFADLAERFCEAHLPEPAPAAITCASP